MTAPITYAVTSGTLPTGLSLNTSTGVVFGTPTVVQEPATTVTITATFEPGTNVDQAVFNLNNRVQLALPRLPDEVRRAGVIVQKRSIDILLVVDTSGSMEQKDYELGGRSGEAQSQTSASCPHARSCRRVFQS
jgi:hypothetical protein